MSHEHSFLRQRHEQQDKQELPDCHEGTEKNEKPEAKDNHAPFKQLQEQQHGAYRPYSTYGDNKRQQLTQLPLDAYPREFVNKSFGGYTMSPPQYLPSMQQPNAYLYNVPNTSSYMFQPVSANEPRFPSSYSFPITSIQAEQPQPQPPLQQSNHMSQYTNFPSLVSDAQRKEQMHGNPGGLEPYGYRNSLNAQYYPAHSGAYMSPSSISPAQPQLSPQSLQLGATDGLLRQQYYGPKIMMPLTQEENYEYEQQQQQQQLMQMHQLQQLQLQHQQLQKQQLQLQEAHHKRKYKLWSEEEDQRLLDLKRNKLLSWKDIATRFSDRTLHACQFRWRKISPYLSGEDVLDADRDSTEYIADTREVETRDHQQKDREAKAVDHSLSSQGNQEVESASREDDEKAERKNEANDRPLEVVRDRKRPFSDTGDDSEKDEKHQEEDIGPREMKIRNILN